jgi:hypothetical protein
MVAVARSRETTHDHSYPRLDYGGGKEARRRKMKETWSAGTIFCSTFGKQTAGLSYQILTSRI